jgi:hypothetical protein
MSPGRRSVVLTGRTKGTTQLRSSPSECVTHTRVPKVHVAHRTPRESLAITTASAETFAICTGKPASSEYFLAPRS